MKRYMSCAVAGLLLAWAPAIVAQVASRPAGVEKHIRFVEGGPWTPSQVAAMVYRAQPSARGTEPPIPLSFVAFVGEHPIVADFIPVSTEKHVRPRLRELIEQAVTTDKELARALRWVSPHNVLIFAKRENEAKRLTLRFFQAMNDAWESQREQYIRDSIDSLQKRLNEAKTALSQQETELADARETLTGIGPDVGVAVDELRKRRVLLDVEISGLKAKLAAARKLLTELPETATSQRSVAESVIVATGIDLAGHAAKQARIKDILAAHQKLVAAGPALQDSRRSAGAYEFELQRLQEAAKGTPEPFAAVNGKVFVHQIVVDAEKS